MKLFCLALLFTTVLITPAQAELTGTMLRVKKDIPQTLRFTVNPISGRTAISVLPTHFRLGQQVEGREAQALFKSIPEAHCALGMVGVAEPLGTLEQLQGAVLAGSGTIAKDLVTIPAWTHITLGEEVQLDGIGTARKVLGYSRELLLICFDGVSLESKVNRELMEKSFGGLIEVNPY